MLSIVIVNAPHYIMRHIIKKRYKILMKMTSHFLLSVLIQIKFINYYKSVLKKVDFETLIVPALLVLWIVIVFLQFHYFTPLTPLKKNLVISYPVGRKRLQVHSLQVFVCQASVWKNWFQKQYVSLDHQFTIKVLLMKLNWFLILNEGFFKLKITCYLAVIAKEKIPSKYEKLKQPNVFGADLV